MRVHFHSLFYSTINIHLNEKLNIFFRASPGLHKKDAAIIEKIQFTLVAEESARRKNL